VFYWESGNERDSGVFGAEARDLREFREVSGESTDIKEQSGQGN
jgi:hypothetical protein